MRRGSYTMEVHRDSSELGPGQVTSSTSSPAARRTKSWFAWRTSSRKSKAKIAAKQEKQRQDTIDLNKQQGSGNVPFLVAYFLKKKKNAH